MTKTVTEWRMREDAEADLRAQAEGRHTSNDNDETILDWLHEQADWRSPKEIAAGTDIILSTVQKRLASLGKRFAVESRTRNKQSGELEYQPRTER